MSLEKKYGLSQAQIKAMYLGGDLPCSVFRREQIITCFNKFVDQGLQRSEAYKHTSDEIGVSLQYVYYVIKRS